MSACDGDEGPVVIRSRTSCDVDSTNMMEVQRQSVLRRLRRIDEFNMCFRVELESGSESASLLGFMKVTFDALESNPLSRV